MRKQWDTNDVRTAEYGQIDQSDIDRLVKASDDFSRFFTKLAEINGWSMSKLTRQLNFGIRNSMQNEAARKAVRTPKAMLMALKEHLFEQAKEGDVSELATEIAEAEVSGELTELYDRVFGKERLLKGDGSEPVDW